jgi:hypothetical protein
MRGKSHLEDADIDGRILWRVSEKYERTVWNGFIRLRMGMSRIRWWTFGFHEVLWVYWLPMQLLACQESLRSMELFKYSSLSFGTAHSCSAIASKRVYILITFAVFSKSILVLTTETASKLEISVNAINTLNNPRAANQNKGRCVRWTVCMHQPNSAVCVCVCFTIVSTVKYHGRTRFHSSPLSAHEAQCHGDHKI